VEEEPFTVEWIERSLRPGDVFYDVGANVGADALIAARRVPDARVFAFEPSPASYHALAGTILLNDCAGSITPVVLALWSHSALLPITFASLDTAATPTSPRLCGSPRVACRGEPCVCVFVCVSVSGAG
jgi:FkbM family methyltransferase